MNPRELHSPVPFRDADYAAVRARVLADIHAGRRRWRWTFALASAAMIAVALWLQMPKPKPQPQPKTAVSQWSAGALTRAVPAPEPTPVTTPIPHREDPAKPIATKPAEPLRIELHTSDPDIRIIWIVNPKEES